eukprot:NODE_143_length_17796_cov_0.252020.p3 type:complete len:513 gc:universal NODE_143_length_17796_cov_0.252020:9845-11383(+)
MSISSSPLIKKKSSEADLESLTPEDQGYPKSIYFIVGNEFAERFTFYGIKAVLFLFMTDYKHWTGDEATALIHSFNTLAYFMPLMGSILADSYWGKFRTILYLSLLYCCGSILIAISAVPGTNDQFTLIGLLLLAIGTGGIKPNVSSFGADQLIHSPRYVPLFFSMFYFSINAGSVLSMFFTPILRGDLHCFQRQDCFPAAFGVPAIFMLLATILFYCGKKYYLIVPPSNSNLVNELIDILTSGFFGFIADAKSKGLRNADFWLHPVNDGFNRKRVFEFKSLMHVFQIMLPLPLFWALYDQQGSRWTSQAKQMNPHFIGLVIKPDQMPTSNAVLILAFIPLFNRFLYPVSSLLPQIIQFHNKPLRKMGLGMFLCGCSFVVSSLLQVAIDRSPYKPDDPSSGVCIIWQIVQYVIVTASEILFSITGLEFAYSESPMTLKSMAQAGWLLTVAIGNLIVVIVAESKLFDLANEMIFFAMMIWGALILFISLSWNYRSFKDRQNEESVEIEDENDD